LKKNIIFPIFHGHKNTQFNILSYFGKLQILGCYSVVIVQEVLHELKVSKTSGVILKLDFEKAYDKVSWSFLEKVMRAKGFDELWIQWINSVVKGGRVCIDLNGERGEYFRSFKGLQQGDPLSPLLFNLVADALFNNAIQSQCLGHHSGFGPKFN